ncbi:carbohydrate-binding module family 43 protein [Athelia psychrophila]|uniref:1,3-beta-glucanosyltransferase n=1 Tax=Athelia psychrophila TaxID=1759441 RepID=A0A166U099_9AGAM|nr:carbohydrate-binding module family 43 protein [Fibularhizoctonia sp. CBS 109695]
MRSVLRATAFLLAGLVADVSAISKITRQGRYLYNSTQDRFYIQGVAYQEQGTVISSAANAFGEPSSFIDPLSNGTACQRDLPFLQQLKVNTIRAYSVNSSLNHDDCMQLFSNAGIYTIIDLTLPVNGSIDRASPSWSTNLLNLYTDTIDAFAKYDNVLAYNVGNEVVIQSNGTDVAAYVKAAARDIKAYLTSKSSSALVGYASIDGTSDFKDPLANYLSCDPSNGNSGSTSIDLYGLNNYEWCGNSTFEASYAGVEGDFAGYNVPAYFSEFGCITAGARDWTEVAALFSSQMSPVWSGGLAFSYFPATSVQGQFGMVNISADGSTVTPLPDFDTLVTQYGQVNAPNTPLQGAAGSTSYPGCPAQNATWLASPNLPPTPDNAACACLEQDLSCQFTPEISNYTIVVGELLDAGCSLLAQAGGNCNDISSSGASGTYGRVSYCDPPTKLSFVFTQYYQANNRNPVSCSFAGNATVNGGAPSDVSSANAAATACFASVSAVFTPTSPVTASSSATGSSTSKSGSSNGALPLIGDLRVFWGLGLALSMAIASGVWTLA